MSTFPSWPDEVAVVARHWLWEREPVFHLHRDPCPSDPKFHLDVTRCGIVLFKAEKGGGAKLIDRAVDMRLAHAAKIGRPCRRCFGS